ncbi:MAG: hypothetical protein ACOY4H_05435 [Thermodesulfobacteriota bacterium]
MKIQAKLLVDFLGLSLPFLVASQAVFYVTERDALKENILNHHDSVTSIQQQRIRAISQQNAERLRLVTSRTQLRISLARFFAIGAREELARITTSLRDADNLLGSGLERVHIVLFVKT